MNFIFMSNLKKVKFVKELEKLVQDKQKTISAKRLYKIMVDCLYEKSGIINDLLVPMGEAGELSDKYLKKHNYSENQRGYTLQN